MQMIKGNLAILDHAKNNKQILLFESVSIGYVRFSGFCSYISHHIDQRPDKNASSRNAIIFHLDIDSTSVNNEVNFSRVSYLTKPKKTQSLKQLRDIDVAQTPKSVTSKEKLQHIQYRSTAIKLYAKKRSGGKCEACGCDAPFVTKSGPYLEVHHLTKLADGGTDIPENVIAVCPTCHRRAHYSVNKDDFNQELIYKVQQVENNQSDFID